MGAHVFVASIGALLPVTNPVFVVATYAGLTESFSRRETRRQAVLVGVYSFAILATFAVLGTLVLHAFGISLYALQIAGGLVVAYAGFAMLSAQGGLAGPGDDGPEDDGREDDGPGDDGPGDDGERRHRDVAISPMALPIVAGPGAIGVVTALAARNPGTVDHVAIVAAVATIAAALAVLLSYATPVIGRLGAGVVGALVRVMGFLILAIGVELVVHGILDVPH
jgi:multiple antibiotic resistance protein